MTVWVPVWVMPVTVVRYVLFCDNYACFVVWTGWSVLPCCCYCHVSVPPTCRRSIGPVALSLRVYRDMQNLLST